MLGSILTLGALSSLALAAPLADADYKSPGQQPFKFPLSNGFPNIAVPSDALTQIEKQAHGTLSNGAPPTNVSANSLESFRLIAFNEIFEVAFFTSLINNITNNVDGYKLEGAARTIVLNALTAVQAQEELHAIGANGLLAANHVDPIKPCEYIFPVSNFDDAIALAATFTDVVLATLQDVQFNLGISKDTEIIPLVGAVIGQEGEQDGYYRFLEGKTPSALPFLTTGARAFAFSALNQNFIVPKSCPNANTIDFPIFGALSVDTPKIQLKDQTLDFSITASNTDGLHVVYINQLNKPVVESITNAKKNGDKISFQAQFPGATNEMNGLTLVAVTNSAGPFANAEAVAAAAKFGPGLIEIN